MLNNSSKILFSLTLMAGTLVTASSNSWVGGWMGLEINLLSFIPLMASPNNLMSTESSLKYFLVQALASSTLLMAIITMMLNTKSLQFTETESLPPLIIASSLLLKSGAAPLHFWFPPVMEGLTWTNSLILMTWQKIAPLILMSYLNPKLLMVTSVFLSITIGALGGLNQSSLRKLMAYSSISHIGWMLAAMMSSEEMWILYFSMYFFMSLPIILMFNSFKMYHFNQLFNTFFTSKSMKFTLFISLLSMGGLPPFFGFLPKWMVIQTLTMNNQLLMMTTATILTLITLFFYLRIAFSALMMNQYETNWSSSMNTANSNTLMYMSSLYISLGGLPAVSMMYSIM